jgi:hypothetical protein
VQDVSLPRLHNPLPAGGGGGGAIGGGGGGAGGLIHVPSYSVTPGVSYSVTVGAGGEGRAGSFPTPFVLDHGGNGQDSTFGSSAADTLRAAGGAGGISVFAAGFTSGGSGGGLAPCRTDPCAQSAYTLGQGFPGGAAVYDDTQIGAGGGGGAGEAGGDASAATCRGGAGGRGLPFDIETPGTPKYYAGGGGGNSYTLIDPPGPCLTNYGGVGGEGGGGTGEAGECSGHFGAPCTSVATAGAADTGGGGGGGGDYLPGAAGGSGVVILRY